MTTAETWRVSKCGLMLRVRLTPRSFRDAVEGVDTTADGPAIKARVRAVPENGKANAALEHLIADWLDVPLSAVTLSSGGKSRVKTIALTGDPKTLAAQISARLQGLSAA